MTFEAKVSLSESQFWEGGTVAPVAWRLCDADEIAGGETFGHLPLFKLKQLQCRSTPNSPSRGERAGWVGGGGGVWGRGGGVSLALKDSLRPTNVPPNML